MSGRLEITNLDMKVGTTLKVKGRIPDDADGNAGKTLASDTPSPAKDPTTQNAPFSGALQVYPGSRTDPAKSNLVASVTGFAINLGQGADKLGLHLNPRFKESTIVCNSKDGHWGTEQRDGHLCFGPGSEVKVTVAFQSDEFQVKLPDGHQLAFPNRMGLGHLSYLSVQGGLLVSSFKLD